MKLKTLILSLLMLQLVTIKGQGTQSGQSIILDSNEVVYTLKQDLNCIRCLMNEPLKDSLIKLYKVNQSDQDTIITNLSTHNAILIQMDKDNKVELKKRRKNVFKYSLISFGIGFILSIFVL